jgi:hypothetical protein
MKQSQVISEQNPVLNSFRMDFPSWIAISSKGFRNGYPLSLIKTGTSTHHYSGVFPKPWGKPPSSHPFLLAIFHDFCITSILQQRVWGSPPFSIGTPQVQPGNFLHVVLGDLLLPSRGRIHRKGVQEELRPRVAVVGVLTDRCDAGIPRISILDVHPT